MDVAFYNETDAYAAQWLRNLINAGLIAPGVVDERSIEDLTPGDLIGYTQCHFFAGFGTWSYALRRAGWPDSRRVWTASCPCQPFSSAGEGAGFADQRHLWSSLHFLAEQCDIECIIGEQVASKDADAWLDLVQTDMEALGYAFGAVAFPSASVGAPHIRDRTYWVANTKGMRLQGLGRRGKERTSQYGETRRLANTAFGGRRKKCADVSWGPGGDCEESIAAGSVSSGPHYHQGPTNGFWGNAEWLGCLDSRLRPVEPGTFPLAHGAAGRVGRLRAYGNAINAEQATIFIEACIGAINEHQQTIRMPAC